MRAAKVRIRAQDENGKWFEMDGDELLARAFQHEIDHLDGIVFIFRMSAAQAQPESAQDSQDAKRRHLVSLP